MSGTKLVCCILLLTALAGCGRQQLPSEVASVRPGTQALPTEVSDPLEQTTDATLEASVQEEWAAPPSAPSQPTAPDLPAETPPVIPTQEVVPTAEVPPPPDTSSPVPDLQGQPDEPSLRSLVPVRTTSTLESELLSLINQERTRNGLEALGVQDSMQFAANIRAQEVLDELSHTRPDGTAYHTAFEEAGFPYAGKWHGENVALIQVSEADFDETAIAAALFTEWKKSPGHEQNMLGENFFQTGLGIYIEQDGDQIRIGSVQLFAGF